MAQPPASNRARPDLDHPRWRGLKALAKGILNETESPTLTAAQRSKFSTLGRPDCAEEVPKGRLTRRIESAVPSGLSKVDHPPNVEIETLGYYQTSLRDKEEILVALGVLAGEFHFLAFDGLAGETPRSQPRFLENIASRKDRKGIGDKDGSLSRVHHLLNFLWSVSQFLPGHCRFV